MSASWIAASLAEATICLSALIVLFLILRPLLRRALGSRWLHVLWLLVLARLLLPWPVETRWSLIDRRAHSPGPVEEVASPLEVKMTVSDGARVHAPVGTVAEVQGAEQTTDWNHLLGMIWLGGVALGGVLVLCQWIQTWHWAARTYPASDPRLIAAFESIPAEWRANVELRQTDTLPLATLAGVRKPQIWFPNRWIQELTTGELRNVLLHELGHARRHDLLVQWLFSIALCLHWFNPLVWIAARVARFDREMACDAWVLERSDENGAERYGSTLLRIVQMLRTPVRVSPAVVAMAASRRTLGIRIHQIGAFEKASAWRGVAGICAMLVAIAAVTTSRGSDQAAVGLSEPSRTESSDSIESTGASIASFSDARVELETILVDVAKSTFTGLSKDSPALRNLTAAPKERRLWATEESKAFPLTHVGGKAISLLTAEEVSVLKPVFETRSGPDFRAVLARETKGVNLLAAGRVTARSGQEASMEILPIDRYPTEFDSETASPDQRVPKGRDEENLGLTILPTVEDENRISFDLALAYEKLKGDRGEESDVADKGDADVELGAKSSDYKSPGGAPKNAPQKRIFTRRQRTAFKMSSGQTFVLGVGIYPAHADEKGNSVEERVLFAFVTAKILPAQSASEPAGQETASTSPNPANVVPFAAPAAEKLPLAIWVPEKAGFGRSPYSPDAGLIDLHGFPPGVEVKCPYTGKMFLVPPEEQPLPNAKSGGDSVSGESTPSDAIKPQKDKPVLAEELPIHLTADQMSTENGVTVARNHAVLQYKDMKMSADTITYESERKVAIGVENVEVSSRGNTVTGVHIELDLKTTAVRTRGPSRTKINKAAP